METRDIKDDVKLPEGEMGEELKKVFAEEKEVRKSTYPIASIFYAGFLAFYS